jgi:hypothetical protein
MTLLLANVYIDTARSSYNPETGVTGPYAPYLIGIPARINSVSNHYKLYGDAALSSDYVMVVDRGTDITAQDRITTIYLNDRVTFWPGNPFPFSMNDYWSIVITVESASLFLASRIVFIKRVCGGGPVHF